MFEVLFTVAYNRNQILMNLTLDCDVTLLQCWIYIAHLVEMWRDKVLWKTCAHAIIQHDWIKINITVKKRGPCIINSSVNVGLKVRTVNGEKDNWSECMALELKLSLSRFRALFSSFRCIFLIYWVLLVLEFNMYT